MKFLKTISSIFRNSSKFPPFFRNVSTKNISQFYISSFYISSKKYLPKKILSSNNSSRNLSSKSTALLFRKTSATQASAADDSDSENDSEDPTKIDEEFIDIIQEQHISVKDILYPQSKDFLIHRLKNCASISEVFDVLNSHSIILNHKHIAQSILVLWDLQKMYYHINVVNNAVGLNKFNQLGINRLTEDFMGELDKNESFSNLLRLVEIKIDEFDQEALACILLYLHKIGLGLQHKTLQIVVEKLRETFKEEGFSLSALSRFMVVIFSENSLGAYYCVQDLLPQIYEKINDCKSSEEFKMLTICLSSVHTIVTEEVMLNYKEKLRDLIKSVVVNNEDHRAILKAIIFLNTAKFREDNLDVINECIGLLKDHMYALNLNDLLTFYDVSFDT